MHKFSTVFSFSTSFRWRSSSWGFLNHQPYSTVSGGPKKRRMKIQGVCFGFWGAKDLKPLNFLAPFGGAWSKVKLSSGRLSWVNNKCYGFFVFFRGKKHHEIMDWMFGDDDFHACCLQSLQFDLRYGVEISKIITINKVTKS